MYCTESVDGREILLSTQESLIPLLLDANLYGAFVGRVAALVGLSWNIGAWWLD